MAHFRQQRALTAAVSLTATVSLAACGGSVIHTQAVPAALAHVAAQSAEGADAPRILVTASPDRHPRRMGTYIGPRNDGRNRCGYVAAGPGAEQASAFTVTGVSCHTARTLAASAAGHETDARSYEAQGFRCTGTRRSARTVLSYVCESGRRTVRFVIS